MASTAAANAPDVVYAPGACNIAHDEVAYRRKFGSIAAAITAAIAVVLFALGAPFWAFLLLAIPATGAAIGFIQAQENFCVRYAAQSTYNVSPGYDNAARVDDEKAHRADMAKARTMNIKAISIGIATGVVLAAIAALVG